MKPRGPIATTTTTTITPAFIATLKQRLQALRLLGMLEHFCNHAQIPEQIQWLTTLCDQEELYRSQRSLERRTRNAQLKRYKPLADFDWSFPKQCDRLAIQELLSLNFMQEAANVIFMGQNGVGKTMLASNLAHQALIQGHTVLFTTAGKMLGDLAAAKDDATLQRRLRHYATPDLLVVDEVGYLAYSNRQADLFFELTNRRYESKSTILTTNLPFKEWDSVFPNAACVVSLVDRLVHRCEIVHIQGDSYRHKEATERNHKKQPTKRTIKKKE